MTTEVAEKALQRRNAFVRNSLASIDPWFTYFVTGMVDIDGFRERLFLEMERVWLDGATWSLSRK